MTNCKKVRGFGASCQVNPVCDNRYNPRQRVTSFLEECIPGCGGSRWTKEREERGRSLLKRMNK